MNQSGGGALRVAANVIDKISIGAGEVSAVANIVLCLLVFAGVASRYLFSVPIEWRDECSAYIFILANVLCLCYATYAESHVSAEMLYDRFPVRVKRVIDIAGYCLILIFISFIVYYGFQTTASYYARDWRSETAYEFTLWPIMASIPVGFFLFGLQCIAKLIGSVRRLRAGQ